MQNVVFIYSITSRTTSLHAFADLDDTESENAAPQVGHIFLLMLIFLIHTVSHSPHEGYRHYNRGHSANLPHPPLRQSHFKPPHR